jgi:hypothetical protein
MNQKVRGAKCLGHEDREGNVLCNQSLRALRPLRVFVIQTLRVFVIQTS